VRHLVILVVLVLGLAGSGCSYQTANSPKGGLTLLADFTDVQNLAVGHSVQINNVRIGTVMGIDLIGSGATYRVRVKMSIKKGIRIPQGAAARLSITSLLGENFVALEIPPAGLNTGPFLADHAVLTSTRVLPAFEQVVGRAGPLLQALAGNDISTIVDAGATAFGGKGPALQKMVKQVADLLELFAYQRRKLDGAVTDLARLGGELAKGQDELTVLPERLAKVTKLLADDKDQLLDTLSKITALARTTNATVLAGHVDEIRQMVDQLGPVLSTLAQDKSHLATLISTMQAFVAKVPKAVYNGQLLLYPVLKLEGLPGKSDKVASNTSAVSLMNALNALMGGRPR
jgi:phospholipid/cholesterol/gamma-HCH transport system substrate-binding protein